MSEHREGTLFYDTETGRYDIRFDLESFYGGLHCGECFDVKVKNVWVPVRIEMGDDWYLVGLNVSRLDGLVRSGKNIHATMIYPFVRMLQEKCRDLTEEQIHKTLWKEYEISGADRMFVERASKILEPYEGESEDEK